MTKIVKDSLISHKQEPVILASGSKTRRQQLIDAGIPFEIIVSNVDETPDKKKSFRDQLAEIAMRKAQEVLRQTKNRGLRLIIAGDQNMVFEGKMFGKPESIDEAREILKMLRGSKDLYAYNGNAVLLVEKDLVLQSINVTDVVRLSIDDISDGEIDDYIRDGECLNCCGGISITDAPFVHLVQGRESTVKGITLEYVEELLPSLS